MKIVPRNKKAIPIIKNICEKIFKANIVRFDLFSNMVEENAVVCHLKSKDRLAIWYDQAVQARSVMAIVDASSYECVIRTTFDTIDELKEVNSLKKNIFLL